ncbi:hypothetical protein PENTCL1PPCAC_13764 [Pristionchus entomophagus]|uniref:Uncharacterized protein n=1 Tax=Pristionchus entomophagus TaxID=358040 RepID=A0AAV5TCV6_9BILA|nr:hypothetical protein PENTCL1PPCAC_13764 [Pristionchus entomophagus]
MATEQLLSLSEDDFEVIQSGVDSTYRSIDPSLNDSLVLPPMLVSTTTLVDENTIKNGQATISNDHETALLNSSISIASSHSSDAISAMLRSQSETMSLMEKQLQEFSIIHESIKASNSLQSKVDELSTMNERLEKELDEARSQLMSLKTISDSIQSDVRQEAIDEIRKKDAIISSLSLQVISLEQARQHAPSQPQEQVLQRAPSFDEVEKLRQENASLHKSNTQLHSQLSEEYAKRLNERALRKTLQSSVDSMSLTGSISVEDQQVTRAIQELMAKSDECEKQRLKIRELEEELNTYKADSANNGAIIAVLQDENNEGTRMLAENRRNIDAMKRTLEKYGHFNDF